MANYACRVVATLQVTQLFSVESKSSLDSITDAAEKARSMLPEAPGGLQWVVTEMHIEKGDPEEGGFEYHLTAGSQKLP